MKTRLAVAVASIAVMTFISGCGGGLAQGMYNVSGTVTYNGNVVTTGSVEFYPVDEKQGQPTAVTISSNGGYLATVKAGDYTVAVRSIQAEESAMPKAPTGGALVMQDMGIAKKLKEEGKLKEPKSNIPIKYANAKSSGLSVKVSKNGTFDIKLSD